MGVWAVALVSRGSVFSAPTEVGLLCSSSFSLSLWAQNGGSYSKNPYCTSPISLCRYPSTQDYWDNKLKGAEPDLSAATYQIHDESHTIGNALRWMLMKKYVAEM